MITRKLLAATALMSAIGFSYAQTPAAPVAPAAGTAQSSPDPLVQKRQADHDAKQTYKADKKAAKKEYKSDKKAAKADLKEEKAASKADRDAALKADPIPKVSPGH